MQHDSSKYRIGVDEVGRGPIWGFLSAAAVMMPLTFSPDDEIWKQIKDSKKLSEKKRMFLRDYICKNALCYGIGVCSHEEIDDINVLQASIKAMTKAINSAHEMLKKNHPAIKIDEILIDGDRYKNCYIVPGEDILIPHTCVPNGDNIHLNIAAASIVAKCFRDEYIVNECKLNPVWNDYDLAKNKGYGTAKHMHALKTLGYLPEHRKTFGPVAATFPRNI
jgi:ribonuclease HII